MVNFKIDKIDKEKAIVTYNVLSSKYIIEMQHNNILSFKSKINKYATDLEWDFYNLFNINSTQDYINSEDMNFIIRCLVYILDNRNKIEDNIEHYSDLKDTNNMQEFAKEYTEKILHNPKAREEFTRILEDIAIRCIEEHFKIGGE